MGSEYSRGEDYTKKVSEYDTIEDDEFLPNLEFYNFSGRSDRLMEMFGEFEGNEDAAGSIRGAYTDRFSAALQYRSFVRQIGQDMLENMNAREYLHSADTVGGEPYGGKSLTHEIHDPDADYH